MTADFQEHQDYYDWFVRTTRPLHSMDTHMGAVRAAHANIGLVLYTHPTTTPHSKLGVALCYLRPGHPGWDLSTANLSDPTATLSQRLDSWSLHREAIIELTGIGRDIRQLAILTAMLAWQPASSTDH